VEWLFKLSNVFKFWINMIKKLTKVELKKAQSIKSEFSRVRTEIDVVRERMDELNLKAGTLVRELEDLRESEKDFIESLNKKYGDGNLNPFEMTYETL